MNDALTLSALYVYPLKSAGAVALPRAHLGLRGLDLDRHWMAVDPAGRQLTARQHPKLTLIQVELHPDALLWCVPGMPPLTVPLRPEGPARAASMWGEPLAARAVGGAARTWMETYLERSCDVVQLDPAAERRMNPLYGTNLVSFADGNPLHLVSEASLADLNARLAEPVDALRFRPNLVVTGGTAYQEDCWSQLHTRELDLAVVEACARCSVVNVEAGRMLAEPLRTLAGYRRQGRTVPFGQNLTHTQEGWFTVGEPLRAE